MLQNAYFLAKIGADTAENEQHFAEILPKIGNYPTGPLGTELVPEARDEPEGLQACALRRAQFRRAASWASCAEGQPASCPVESVLRTRMNSNE